MFPRYFYNINSDTFYYDKYLYLITVKLGGLYRYYPEYINNELDENIRNNKKRLFRTSCINYDINNDLVLCFKYKLNFNNKNIDEKSKSSNRHKKKLKDEYELRKIPNVKNVISLLEELHKEINHQGYKKLKTKIDELKIYYKGINEDMKNISNLCDICIKKKVVYYKREPSKQIIMERPKERFVMDITYIFTYRNNR